jgi:hypothetical protein
MAGDSICATTVIGAPADVIFGLLADPAQHPAIDGTGRVREALDSERLTASGQIFRVSMFHEHHPDGHYRMANRVQVYDPPRAISWEPGHYTDDGSVRFGGWLWRYDLAPAGPDETAVTLTYDWSAVPAAIRERVPFPPFAADHLADSLSHLAALATGSGRSRPD